MLWGLDARRWSAAALIAAAVAAASGVREQPTLAAQPLPPLSEPVIEVAAFRVAPVALSGGEERSRNTPANAAARKERVIEVRAHNGEDWENLFQRIAVALTTTLPVAAAQVRHLSLPQLLPGKYLRVRATLDGTLDLEYVITPEEAYSFLLSGASLQVRRLDKDARAIERMRADPSKASLFTATDAVGLPETIALQLTEIFAGKVDFLRELHQGYRCAIVYEAHYREGFIERSGRILAAELEIGKRVLRAYYSPDTQGRNAYFDESGKSTQRLFRRSPLEFTRITSDFTLARFHPILSTWTAHRGVDYAAPTGTKVMTVADGVVEFAGDRGGYGNLVVVRHPDRFMTYYAHLNAFAAKLAVGDKVTQGQTIGYVGMTGLATGPHLHFEFHVRGQNGLWTAVPAPDVIDATVHAAPGFAERVQRFRNSLSVAGQGNVLNLE
jgi:hypothetical protein